MNWSDVIPDENSRLAFTKPGMKGCGEQTRTYHEPSYCLPHLCLCFPTRYLCMGKLCPFFDPLVGLVPASGLNIASCRSRPFIWVAKQARQGAFVEFRHEGSHHLSFCFSFDLPLRDAPKQLFMAPFGPLCQTFHVMWQHNEELITLRPCVVGPRYSG